MRVFRNDDVNANTNMAQLAELYAVLREFDPSAEIWSCVTVLSKTSQLGSVYPSLPLKLKPFHYFLEVDDALVPHDLNLLSRVVSHGLWHLDHSKIEPQLQEASIVSSCRLLKTDIFVPPFNNWNGYTEMVCERHGIQLVKYEEGWKSFEHNEYDPSHDLWYFHSWKWTPERLRSYLQHGFERAAQ